MVGGGKPLGDSVLAGHAAAGAAAISASTVSVHPLDTLGSAGQKQKMGLRQVVDRLMAASGPAVV
nr:unnamed protein product [Digitaria exilis]